MESEQHQQSKSRNPFDDDAKLEVDPVGALCDRLDWTRDNLLYLSNGTQTVVSGQMKLDATIADLRAKMEETQKALVAAQHKTGLQLEKLSERQLWVVGMAAAPCLLVLAVGVLAGWHYFHGAFVVSVATAAVLP